MAALVEQLQGLGASKTTCSSDNIMARRTTGFKLSGVLMIGFLIGQTYLISNIHGSLAMEEVAIHDKTNFSRELEQWRVPA